MEFYLYRYIGILGSIEGFNSQRDGILPLWDFLIYLSQTKVSIPNGMEFYLYEGVGRRVLLKFQFPTGWNSTARDISMFISFILFQFPTGWNSTRESKTRPFERWSFNSQRDGILRYHWHRRSPYSSVSIPNGMEFYR